jgi:hypothetical protein
MSGDAALAASETLPPAESGRASVGSWLFKAPGNHWHEFVAVADLTWADISSAKACARTGGFTAKMSGTMEFASR